MTTEVTGTTMAHAGSGMRNWTWRRWATTSGCKGAPTNGVRRNNFLATLRFFNLGSALASALVAMSSTSVFADPPYVEREHAPEIRLAHKTVSLPITLVREFPFIEGEIAGVKGKLMLDTGMRESLVINDHRVPLSGGEKIGTGHFGSGQSFDIRRHSVIRDIRIGDLSYPSASNVRSQDARMLEKITPDFLGWVGYDFFSSHAMKLDYRHLRVSFHEGEPASFLAGERHMATLEFETRKLPNIPLLRGRIGNLDAIVSLDTGMYGSLNLPEDKRRLLFEGGLLKPTADPDAFDLRGIRIAGRVDFAAAAIEVEEGPSPSAKPVGISEDTELELGFVLLKRYKTVWDFRRKRLYLLAR
ncbi:hypothetical protein AYR46_07515 [Sphingobium yanoikuyae]|uniref:Aspartyl protease n=1 Tax=Sphingobium yanoikuyae TaxID=13690 RepID=A0A3G2UYZ0_SPHYA|nr:hypothetical protein [Sphingobium yanoikuyae]AYO80055.1 hypothetical protein EBF16_26220 [Sphingobium yanoikuyae]KZC81116.1 hypothetical protein AYR46_07515 [Sphingobium yanoikuyae]